MHSPTGRASTGSRQIDGKASARAGSLSPLTASLTVAAWLVLFDNRAFWQTFWGAQTPWTVSAVLSTGAIALVLIIGFGSLLRLLAGSRANLVLLGTVLVVSASVAHYVDAWGVLFDKNMVRNIVESDPREASELLSWPSFLDVALRGVLPVVLLGFLGVRTSRGTRTALEATMLTAATAVIAGIVLLAFYGTLAATFRSHRELRFQLVPTNYLNATYGYLKGSSKAKPVITVVGADASRAAVTTDKPLVLVLIVGETARAANFSLGGYRRETNKALNGSGVVYFSDVASCGTDTATSLPCMFSDLGARDFTVSAANGRENALDVLQKAGVSVEWLDNNSGCKGVCARVPSQQMPTSGIDKLCSEGNCLDEVLIQALGRRLESARKDSTIVLHQMGSHGPSYFKRYPTPGPFQPTCDTNRIQTCEVTALVNTYDNSIDYTSQVIAQAIEVARSKESQMDVAVVYLSDHGESLGERNIYLHGLPLLLAPSEQTRVPMMIWMSKGAQERTNISNGCMQAIADSSLSHDTLFPTLLGFFSVETSAYRSDLDVLALARKGKSCKAGA